VLCAMKVPIKEKKAIRESSQIANFTEEKNFQILVCLNIIL